MKMNDLLELFDYTADIQSIVRFTEKLEKQDNETIRRELPAIIDQLQELEMKILLEIIAKTYPSTLN